MAEITNELMYEILRSIQDRVIKIDGRLDQVESELRAIRGHMLAQQQDIANIYATLARHEQRLERIERRLELTETV
jgi:hypothetical protein